MIRFTGRLYRMNFDVTGYKKTYDEAMKVQIRQAARAWLRAVIPKVPVYTGMARGSLVPLGRFLRVAIPIRMNPNAVKRVRPGYSQQAGEALGAFTFGDNQNGVYTFSYNTQVLHFYLNDTFDTKGAGMVNLIHETPWNATAAGEQAFKDYINNILPDRLPRIIDFVISSAVTTRG